MAGIVLLTQALLIDGTGREPVEGAAVVVEGSLIKDVVPSGRVGPLAGSVTTLDLGGRTLMSTSRPSRATPPSSTGSTHRA